MRSSSLTTCSSARKAPCTCIVVQRPITLGFGECDRDALKNVHLHPQDLMPRIGLGCEDRCDVFLVTFLHAIPAKPLRAFDLSSCPLHTSDGLAVKASNGFALQGAYAQALNLGTRTDERIRGEQVQRIASSAEL